MRTCILLVFCFILKSQNAQTAYSNYLDYTCEWKYYQSSADGGNTKISYITYYIDGDTLINNNYYFKRYFDNVDSLFSFMFGPPTVKYTTRTFFDLIREDSLKRFYTLNFTNSEYILYDFNLSFNDTFTNSFCTVFDIDTLAFNGKSLKWFLQENAPFGKTGFIEGIGQNRFTCGTPFHLYESLVCFTKQNHNLYIDSSKDCSVFVTPNRLTTDIKSFDKFSQITVYPNPAKEKLYLNTTTHSTYSLLEPQGRLVQQGVVENRAISLLDLAKGIYMLRLEDEKGNLYHKRIVKE